MNLPNSVHYLESKEKEHLYLDSSYNKQHTTTETLLHSVQDTDRGDILHSLQRNPWKTAGHPSQSAFDSTSTYI